MSVGKRSRGRGTDVVGRAAGEAMKWVVVFAGARDGYQAPLALAERGQLETLVTDWYSPIDRTLARAALAVLPTSVRRRARRRYREGLSSRLVTTSTRAAVRNRVNPGDWAMDDWLGARAGRLASERGSGLLAYSYYAHAAFTAAAPHVPRLLFQVHPHPRSLNALYDEELRRVPEARSSLLIEEEAHADTSRFARLAREPHLADGWIAASSFTAETLAENGIAADRIQVVPYGVDLERFSPGDRPAGRPFRVVFVGQATQRKGLSYLLDAWRSLALPDAELVIAGRGVEGDPLVARHADHVIRRESVSDEELIELYRSADVFCMPSLAEGFGLVYLEALACGTPVIATTCTGARDVVRDGVDGFLVERRDVRALADRLRWCHQHRESLTAMRAAARDQAERFSWTDFRSRLALAVEEFARSWADRSSDRALVAAREPS